ncbi:MAG: trigger factor [Endomicrobiia bacterium]|nr:MAG: trigger factor [Endomicrobiia bacterium]
MTFVNKQIDFKHKIISRELCSINVEVEVSENVIASEVDSIFSQIQKQAKIDGFRQGKIPRNIVAKKFIDESRNKAIKNVINKTLSSVLEKEKFDIFGFPIVDKFNYDFGKNLKYRFTAECHPKIDIKDYRNIPIKKEVFEITDESLDRSINDLRERNAKLVPSKLSEVGESSLVFVDYDAFDSDGKVFPEITAKSYMLDIDFDNTYEEFKKVLRNSKVGDERSTKIEYKIDYPNEALAGKTITFKIKVIEIKEKELPELNDDFAKDLGTENVKDLRIKVKKSMESEEKNRQNMDIEKKIVEYLLNNNKFEVPSSLVVSQEKSLIEKVKKYLESQGVPKEYIQKQIEFENGKLKEEAEKNVRLSYILNAIYKSEDLVVTDSDFEIEKNKIKTLNPGRESVTDKYFLEKKDDILLLLKEKKLFDFLINNAKIEILEKRICH